MIRIRNNSHKIGMLPFGMLLGLGLAILLFVTSISNYRIVSRRIALEQSRRELALNVGSSELQLIEASDAQIAATLLERIRQNSHGRIVWLQLRDGSGNVVAQSGSNDGFSPLAPEFVRAQFRNRQPAFQSQRSSVGDLVVEGFPTRPLAGVKRPGIVEAAAKIDASFQLLWPLRRNLFVSLIAATALLAALGVVALRFRSYEQDRDLERQLQIARRVQADLLPSSRQALPKGF
jgi:hypothetical protein